VGLYAAYGRIGGHERAQLGIPHPRGACRGRAGRDDRRPATPIYQTTSFVFEDTTDAASLFALQKYGNSTAGSPTRRSRRSRSGSPAWRAGSARSRRPAGRPPSSSRSPRSPGAGDHIVAAPALYGGTITQLDVTLRRFGVDTAFVAAGPADVAAAITDRTKLVFAEVIANPSGAVADLAGIAEVAHDAGVPLVVDATMATPYLCRPIEHGADIVIHSATKFLGGHGTTLGGVVVESGTFDWATAASRR
jgi:O-acetylhomoserine (thiol)-lyase